ncbi:MAG: hypothetical protein NT001_02965, partial [Candidatus Woesearchaeota archaeon]|nr:hypothetical protein [Candidatus Woesearchaeota archaeon]
MFERLLLNIKKKSMHNKIKKAKSIIKKGSIKKAESVYRKLIVDYKEFCIKAAYFEKLSIYHDLLDLYNEFNELKKIRGREKKPAEVRIKAIEA